MILIYMIPVCSFVLNLDICEHGPSTSGLLGEIAPEYCMKTCRPSES